MRESIGTVSLLNFIIFFILLVFAFLMGTFSYYKAYRVNNAIVSAIEKFEGYNDYSKEEIEIKLNNLGYERTNFNCGNDNISEAEGYCVYYNNNDYEKETDQYYSYRVTTIIKFQFPVIQNLLRLRVSSRTTRLYNFEDSYNAITKNKSDTDMQEVSGDGFKMELNLNGN